jgi:hypothetical protein
MSLKDRNETRLLVENWRRVLKTDLYQLEASLYQNETEVLEEGFKAALRNAGLAIVAYMATFGPPGEALAEINVAQVEQIAHKTGLGYDKNNYFHTTEMINLVKQLTRLQKATGMSDKAMENYIKYAFEKKIVPLIRNDGMLPSDALESFADYIEERADTAEAEAAVAGTEESGGSNDELSVTDMGSGEAEYNKKVERLRSLINKQIEEK